MSVPSHKRNKSKLTVLTECLDLVRYTNEVTYNEKNFPKRYRQLTMAQINEPALAALYAIDQANELRTDVEEEYQERIALQGKALRLLHNLKLGIDLAYRQYGMAPERLETWAKKCYAVTELLRAWSNADKRKHDAKQNKAPKRKLGYC